jgi:ABC-2 type transport system permease protein
MLNAIGVLLRARLQIARNTFWRGKLVSKLGTVTLVLLACFGAWLVYTLMQGAVSAFGSADFQAALERAARTNPELDLPTDVRPFLAALPSMALFGTLVLLLLTSFGTVLSSLYLSGDLDMLVAAPVPMRAVFVVKLFGGLVAPYLLLFVLLGPALLGYGRGMGYGPAYYVVAIVILLLFPLLPSGLGALLVMAVVRVVPPRRARDIAGVLGGLAGIIWYVASQFSPRLAPRLANIQTLEGLRRLDLPLLPSAWAGRALVAAGEGAWLTLAAYGGLFAALSLAVFGICLVLAERLYYIGWSNMAAQGGRIRTKNQERRTKNQEPSAAGPLQRSGSWFSVLGSLLPQQAAAIMEKDLRVFPRDLRNLQQVLFPLVLAGIWTVQLLGSGDARRVDESLGAVTGVLGPAGISFFVCLSLSNALGGPSVSREGRGFWLLRTAPVAARDILLGKLAIAYLPYPTIGVLFVLLLAVLQRSGFAGFLAALGLVLLVGLGASAIALGVGAAFPRFDWENPQQQYTIQAGCLAPVLYMTYIALAAALAIGAPALAQFFLAEYVLWITAAGWALLLALTAFVVWAAIGFGAVRMENVELA